jgi:hypothetical protein
MTDLFDKKPEETVPPAMRVDSFGPLTEKMSLEEARRFHTANIRDGIECALCGRFDKIYKRKLNSGMARVLILLYKADKKEPLKWVHVLQDLPDVTGGDYGKMVEWGLLKKREGAKEEDDNPDNGYYRITAKGQVFCQGQIKVPKYLYFYHDRLWPVEDDELTTIQEALGTKFNWNELMSETI